MSCPFKGHRTLLHCFAHVGQFELLFDLLTCSCVVIHPVGSLVCPCVEFPHWSFGLRLRWGSWLPVEQLGHYFSGLKGSQMGLLWLRWGLRRLKCNMLGLWWLWRSLRVLLSVCLKCKLRSLNCTWLSLKFAWLNIPFACAYLTCNSACVHEATLRALPLVYIALNWF